MRFLLDESADARLRVPLRALGHDVEAIAFDYPASLIDSEVLKLAHRSGRILITRDRDFGELVFVQQQPHVGVILLRLGSSPPLDLTITRLEAVLTHHAADLHRFCVVTPQLVRVR